MKFGELRMQNETQNVSQLYISWCKLLPTASLLTAHCLLPFAYCLLFKQLLNEK
jgi:hypothetical protein